MKMSPPSSVIGDIIGCLVGVAGVSLSLGHAERAAQVFGAVAAALERIGEGLWPSNRGAFERDLARTQVALGELRFIETSQSGQAMGLDVAAQYGLDLLGEVINSPVRVSTPGLCKHIPARVSPVAAASRA